MGTRGPKTQPTMLHQIKGNPSKKPASQLRDDVSPETAIPECPKFICDEGKKEWLRLSVELEKLGMIAELYRSAFGLYCQAYGRWVYASKRLSDLGDDGLIDIAKSGYKQIGVWEQLRSRAAHDMDKFGSAFGMSPSAISRVEKSTGQTDMFDHATGPQRFFG